MKTQRYSRFIVTFYVATRVLGDLEVVKAFSWSGNNSISLIRHTRQTDNGCSGFKCKTTTDCIPEEKRCDGTVDCIDGSDEFNDCKQITCPGYLFTCDYGACIEKNKKCNGKKDCRDNSDEANCIISDTDSISSNCKSDQFQCKSGQCISLDDKCSGVPECDDRSDETKEVCLNVECPGYTFTCDYGACANGFSRCNGVKDCVDNSDEEGCDSAVVPGPTPKPEPQQPDT
ncbi:hypothetical protein NQ317_003282 [Molorchus minor]|uniref:Uncharacterized protein n=1 Tax=Molorchus minor TaxID=1323400 RepID=A0ABQ9IYR4_9CUCU|nr:hypothetical protein NQ317_003282 [Molorchus minor]